MQATPPPETCFVVISWENNRKVPYQEAAALAKRLRRQSLEGAISQASEAPYAPYSLQACNWYLGAVGKILDIPYFRDRYYDGSADEKLRTADKINEFLAQAVKDPLKTGWRQVGVGIDPGQEITDLANQGEFVIASSHSIPGKTEYGHIALAAPDYLAKESDPAIAGLTGPWIRYSVYKGTPHTTKSTRTSIIFGSRVSPPIWVEYVGNDWRTASGEKKIPCVDLDGDGVCDPLPSGGTPPEPTPQCVGCPPGYHCEHNPERCVRDQTTSVVTPPTTHPPATTKPTVTTPKTTKPTPPTTKPTTAPPTTKPTTKPPTTTQHPA